MAAQKLKVLIVELSSCVALTPRRETYGDESAMNQRMTHSLRGLFTEVTLLWSSGVALGREVVLVL
jgi:hypothetical protein